MDTKCALIKVFPDKCVNCHACIITCPVKYANNGSDIPTSINPDLCIGCGNCLRACKHNARDYIDDFDAFLADLQNGVPMIGLVAPSIAANYPEHYLRINGWLRQLGVRALFDVSFGAELAAKSYIEYLNANSDKTVIAQPCPVIVSYIQLYRPELLPYLAPVHSPMLHTIKMIRADYPEYRDHRIIVLSPCIAKKREFAETGLGDYNVTFQSMERFLKSQDLSLEAFEPVEYRNPPAERAVLFSTPGGLTQTAERWIPEIRNNTRKIEGPSVIYPYLDTLAEAIAAGKAPQLIDCLNCQFGCNAGPGTVLQNQSLDEIEFSITQRRERMQTLYHSAAGKDSENIERVIERHWQKGRFERTYTDRSGLVRIVIPGPEELDSIYQRMHKYSQADLFNCNSCGYGECRNMAIAIHNGLNRPQNCHFYLLRETAISHQSVITREARLRSIINTTMQGFIRIDRDGQIQETNPALNRLLQYASLEGKSMLDLVDGENKAVLLNQLKLRDENKTSVYNLTMQRADGTDVFCQISASPLYDENGRRIGSFAMVSDLAEQRRMIRLEDQTKKAQEANLAKSQFLANMSHEIRTPMNAILGFSDLLAEEALTAGQKTFVETIQSAGRNLLNILNDILDLSKIEAGKLDVEIRDCPLGALLETVKTLMQVKMSEKNLDFKVLLHGPLPHTIHTDSLRLQQCLINLIGNAAKFTQHGQVHLIVSPETRDEHQYLRFDVEDTGIGIEPGKLESIFEPFTQADNSTTRKYGGTGLGLTITSQLVKKLGGRIEARSIPGTGSVFSILLPAPAGEPSAHIDPHDLFAQIANTPTPSAAAHFSGAILIAEDNRANQQIMELILTKMGLTVTTSDNGQRAVEAASAGAYDLIFMDMQMPVMNGYEAARLLRARSVATPIIALTANAMQGDRQKCLDAGCDDYLSKPIKKEEIIQLLRQYLTKTPSAIAPLP